MKKSPLRKKGKSDNAKAKDEIQDLLREYAILRDKGCFLRDFPDTGLCGGYRKKDGAMILQYDHLDSRARNVSFGDERLGVCACLRHHTFFKRQYPVIYEEHAREFIGEERTKLLDKARADKKTYPMGSWEWGKVAIGLREKIKRMKLI